MAEFSKQYCIEYKLKFSGDFDIVEEFNKLTAGYYISQICEGYGFIAIAKDIDHKCLLAYRDKNGNVIWKNGENLINKKTDIC